jgi:hypothetical protein
VPDEGAELKTQRIKTLRLPPATGSIDPATSQQAVLRLARLIARQMARDDREYRSEVDISSEKEITEA